MTTVQWDALKEDMSGEYIGHSDGLMSPWPPECLTVCRNESFFSSQAQSPVQEADLLSSVSGNMGVQLDNNPDWSGHAEPVQTNSHSALYFLWALHSFKTQSAAKVLKRARYDCHRSRLERAGRWSGDALGN